MQIANEQQNGTMSRVSKEIEAFNRHIGEHTLHRSVEGIQTTCAKTFLMTNSNYFLGHYKCEDFRSP